MSYDPRVDDPASDDIDELERDNLINEHLARHGILSQEDAPLELLKEAEDYAEKILSAR